MGTRTASQMSIGQFADLVAKVTQAVPKDLTIAEAQAHIRHAGPSQQAIDMILRASPHSIDPDALLKMLCPEPWQVQKLRKDDWVAPCTRREFLLALASREVFVIEPNPSLRGLENFEADPVLPGWYAIGECERTKSSPLGRLEELRLGGGIAETRVASVEEIIFLLQEWMDQPGAPPPNWIPWDTKIWCRNSYAGGSATFTYPDRRVGRVWPDEREGLGHLRVIWIKPDILGPFSSHFGRLVKLWR